MVDLDKTILTALQEYTTCDISDALCKLNHPAGGFLPGLSMWSPQRQEGTTKIVGPAYTVKYVPLSDPAPKLSTHYIDSVPAGAVIFVSSPKIPNAVYGGIMTVRARARGAVGTIVDGRFRDLQEQRDQGYPVFARDVGTAAPYGLVKVSAVNVPVNLQIDEQDVTIHPGDYIVADFNGVVLLPRDLAAKVIPLMETQVAADKKVVEGLQQGMTFDEASKKFRV